LARDCPPFDAEFTPGPLVVALVPQPQPEAIPCTDAESPAKPEKPVKGPVTLLARKPAPPPAPAATSIVLP
jgi:hypothetical protein